MFGQPLPPAPSPSNVPLPRMAYIRSVPMTGSLQKMWIVSPTGASSLVSRPPTPQVQSPIVRITNTRAEPKIFSFVQPTVEVMPPRQASLVLHAIQERVALGEKCSQLQAAADRRSSELDALQRHRKILQRQFAKCKQERYMLETKVATLKARDVAASACVVCLARKASHFLTPCGHLALCEGCCSLPIQQCPVCRTFCKQKIRLYRP
eukprot:TRINITY_DN25173_c0_g1_i1.p1 TRINITY_DN25173_c0_g1~~TRINITY_DN25173_c0_g1_i1.p1  ORF type:complete len:208 (-),score=23.72 TRINITY_DN25173_c0_g1_i1:182-805(-)